MKFIDEYRSPELVRALLKKIDRAAASLERPVTIMEVCGSHTSAIGRFGIRALLPDAIRLISGPGCPVCVTAAEDIDRALWLAAQPEIIFTSYGDLLRVPGSRGDSLEKIRAAGARIETVHSVLEAAETARRHPEKKVVFMGIGFETTAPTAAAALIRVEKEKLKNFFLYSCHKLMPPVMRSLLDEPELAIDGFLCPGHVSTIIGARAYEFITAGGRAAVIAGFEPVDILVAVELILKELTDGVSGVKLAYPRGVNENGNPRARAVMAEVFEPETVVWRGLGEIPASGLKLKERFAEFDARRQFDFPIFKSPPPSACRCGEVLRGLIRPDACALFGKTCNPATPYGPCMVSGEGSCAAYFRYPEGRYPT